MAASRARTQGLQSQTNAKHSRALRLWNHFLETIGLDSAHDPFLDKLQPPQRLRIVGAFAQAIRDTSSVQTKTLRWQQQQSEIPFHLYRRPLPPTTDQTHSSLFTEKLTVFYTSNSTATEETTPASNINEHYQPSFS